MKKLSFLAIFALVLASCSDDDPTPGPSGTSYMAMTAGSTWNYRATDNSTPTPTSTDYTMTSTNRDTLVAPGRTYHVFENSMGANQYFNITGSDHYDFQGLPPDLGGTNVENLYLKAGAAVGTTWSQPIPADVPGFGTVTVTVTNKIDAKGIAHTVNGIDYSNVIRVFTSFSVPIPGVTIVSNVQSYYAPQVGLIENTTEVDISAFGTTQSINTATKLMSSVIVP